jgi:hypothetical protein
MGKLLSSPLFVLSESKLEPEPSTFAPTSAWSNKDPVPSGMHNIASIAEVGGYLDITIANDSLQATFPRSQHHQFRQVQQMAAPLSDERCIQHASGVDRDDAQEAGPPELLWVREDDGRDVGAELERILP